MNTRKQFDAALGRTISMIHESPALLAHRTMR
jgi:hypothetical protein